jgi:hypothetical protein
MCVVSMVMDHYTDRLYRQLPQPNTVPFPAVIPFTTTPQITQAELDEFRALLERAREYDRKNGEPDCELESKKEALKAIAKALGVEIDFI